MPDYPGWKTLNRRIKNVVVRLDLACWLCLMCAILRTSFQGFKVFCGQYKLTCVWTCFQSPANITGWNCGMKPQFCGKTCLTKPLWKCLVFVLKLLDFMRGLNKPNKKRQTCVPDTGGKHEEFNYIDGEMLMVNAPNDKTFESARQLFLRILIFRWDYERYFLLKCHMR